MYTESTQPGMSLSSALVKSPKHHVSNGGGISSLPRGNSPSVHKKLRNAEQISRQWFHGNKKISLDCKGRPRVWLLKQQLGLEAQREISRRQALKQLKHVPRDIVKLYLHFLPSIVVCQG